MLYKVLIKKNIQREKLYNENVFGKLKIILDTKDRNTKKDLLLREDKDLVFFIKKWAKKNKSKLY